VPCCAVVTAVRTHENYCRSRLRAIAIRACTTSRAPAQRPLEFPTSPFFLGNKLCITQSDVSRRDNFPNTGGEVGPRATGPLVAKISCIDQPLPQAGLALSVP
jgi:hypothetical protein